MLKRIRVTPNVLDGALARAHDENAKAAEALIAAIVIGYHVTSVVSLASVRRERKTNKK